MALDIRENKVTLCGVLTASSFRALRGLTRAVRQKYYVLQLLLNQKHNSST